MTDLLQTSAWTSQSLTFPEQQEFMVIDSNRMRIVTFVVLSVDPVKRAASPNWYRQDRPGVIESRISPHHDWRVFEYDWMGDTIFWTQGDIKVPWVRIQESERPDWVPSRLLKVFEKMDLQEK